MKRYEELGEEEKFSVMIIAYLTAKVRGSSSSLLGQIGMFGASSPDAKLTSQDTSQGKVVLINSKPSACLLDTRFVSITTDDRCWSAFFLGLDQLDVCAVIANLKILPLIVVNSSERHYVFLVFQASSITVYYDKTIESMDVKDKIEAAIGNLLAKEVVSPTFQSFDIAMGLAADERAAHALAGVVYQHASDAKLDIKLHQAVELYEELRTGFKAVGFVSADDPDAGIAFDAEFNPTDLELEVMLADQARAGTPDELGELDIDWDKGRMKFTAPRN